MSTRPAKNGAGRGLSRSEPRSAGGQEAFEVAATGRAGPTGAARSCPTPRSRLIFRSPFHMTFTRANDMHQRFECRCKLRQAAAAKAGGGYAWQQGLQE